MCGHCGVIGPGINSWDLDIVRDMLTVSTLRGVDGAGVLQGKSDIMFDNVRIDHVIEKSASDALFFKWYHSRSEKGNRRILNSTADNFILCHVRAASKGRILDENAHPFEFNKLIGMHNGTMRDKKYDHESKTDSELFIKDMDERGIIPVLESIDPWSAYALVIFNKEDGTISFTRNDQRSLYYAVHDTRAVLYYASEKWMIDEMCARNTEKLFRNEIYWFKPNILYTFHPAELTAKNHTPFTTTHFKPRVAKAYGGRFQQGQWNDAEWTADWEKANNIVPFVPQQDHPKQALLANHLNNGKKLQFNQETKLHINSKTKIPLIFCCGCNKKMSLVDVFFAQKLNASGTTVICNDCNNNYTAEFIQDQKKNEVILN